MAGEKEPIDFVITWVDGSDPVWKKEKAEYSRDMQSDAASMEKEENSLVDDREERYRDYGLLRFWFRGVEQFAPWVRKIHFVTYGHLPKWLDTNNPKLNIVKHEDIIPKEYLPTYNSNVIELYMYRIEGLSEHYVYFNDDMFLINKVLPEFFFREGKPCDLLAFQPVVANSENPVMSHLFLNNALVLAKYFNKRENVKKQPGSYFKLGYPPLYFFYNLLELAFPKFTGFFTVHGPVPFCRQTYRDLWEKEGEQFLEMSGHRFRDKGDLSIYLFRDWQKLTGNFHAQNLLKDFSYFDLSEDNHKLYQTIKGQKKKMICINDANTQIDFERTKNELLEAFRVILPRKSSFEISVLEEHT